MPNDNNVLFKASDVRAWCVHSWYRKLFNKEEIIWYYGVYFSYSGQTELV
jgi:hypothetical protein